MDINIAKKLDIETLFKNLDSSRKGLSSKEAKKRLEKFGMNEIPKKQLTFRERLLKRLWNPIAWMLELAALLSFLLGKIEDFIIVLLLLSVNVGIDLFQEGKALRIIDKLRKKLNKKVIVLRDGKFKEIDSSLLVPGDIIKIKIGDIIPADVKLVEGSFIEVDQSSLTGESALVLKQIGDVAYANSIVKRGEMLALVVSTGKETYFGKTLLLVEKAQMEKQSHLQKTIIRVGNYLMILAAFLISVVILYGVSEGDPLIEILLFALVLLVSSIPVALPAVLTVTMAVGANELAKKGVIVKRLSSIDELAGVDTLCVDKTGTLTKNKMKISSPYVKKGFSEDDLILYASLCSKEENKDPIEVPLFDYLKKRGIYSSLKSYKIKSFIPFDPIRKRTESIVEKNGKTIEISKGAPQVIIRLSSPKNKIEIENKVKEFASKGFRTIAVAIKRKKQSKNWEFVGLIPLYDEIRENTKEAIETAKKFGIDVKMITGDNLEIAKFVSSFLGIGDRILRINEIREDEFHKELEILAEILSKSLYSKLKKKAKKEEVEKFSKEVIMELEKRIKGYHFHRGFVRKHESEIIEIIENSNGFAEVFPQDKYFIVKELQKALHIVAMTGDGVNDAPALKKADIGIAVNNATEAAKDAADLILLFPGIKTIMDGVVLSREIFERMKSYTIFRIAETIRILFFITISILVFNLYPITPLMVILLALLNDIPILSIAYDTAKPSKKPVRWNLNRLFYLSSILGFTGVMSSFLLLFILKDIYYLPFSLIQSIIFAKLVVAGHGTIYNTRSEDWFWKKPLPSFNLFMATFWSRVLGTIIAIFGFGLMEPIGIYWGVFIWAYSILWFLINDLVKVLSVKVMKEKKTLFGIKHHHVFWPN